MRSGNGEAIDDDAIVGAEGIFHAGTDDVVAAIDEAIEDDGADDYGNNKNDKTERVFEKGVFLEERWVHVHRD